MTPLSTEPMVPSSHQPTTEPMAPSPHQPIAEPTSGWRAAFWFRPAWPAVVLVIVLVIGLLARVSFAWGLVIAATIGVTIERRAPRHDQPILRPGLRTDVFHFMFNRFLEVACLAVSIAICAVLLAPLTIPMTRDWLAAQSVLVVGLLGFVLVTFILYWQHRLAHRVPFLWRFHAVHHSSSQLDWIASSRLHPMEFFFGGFLLAPPFLLLGFRPVTVGALTTVTTVWAVIEHANVRWRLRWMDRLYPNPEYHHWHHSLHADAIDKNFGVPLWDMLFGTYYMPHDRRPDTYGIRELMPATYLGQLAHPLRRRPRPLVQTRGQG